MLAVFGWAATTCAVMLAVIGRRLLAGRAESVARACHELRGPLTAARLGLELGARRGELPPRSLRAIDLELSRAALALDDLAGTHGGRSALPKVEEVDIAELLADAVEARRAAAIADDVELTVSWSGGRPRVWGCRLRLAQALGNLLANAIEHGGGVVEVKGRAGAGSVWIEVVDGGTGLPAPVAELARPARWGRGKRGRGLAIASEIVSDHGGRLAAAPSERGARLVLELPASVAARLESWKPTGH